MNKIIHIAKIQLVMRTTSQLWRFIIFIQPILYLMMTLFMMNGSMRTQYSMDAVLGAGMMGTWSSILFSSGSDIDRERRWGTLEMIVGCPTPLSSIIMGKALTNSLVGLFSMGLSYITALLLFRQQLVIKHPCLFMLVLILIIISVAAKGMIICTLFTLSRAVRGLLNVMENPIFLLSGLMFPIVILPLWTRPLSYILSLTWGMDALRMVSSGTFSYKHFLFSLVILLILTFLYLLLSLWLFQIIEKKSRKEATLGVY
ncbi:MAG TPA: ABC transporter permease [Clostridia bacterium]|nr:ABC transporter permease [Clostridia bacterium]